MRIVTGKAVEPIDGPAFRALAAGYGALLLDIGTGDGALPYRLAGQHPDVLFVGVDANAEGMAENARRARRKPARGGRLNCLYVAAPIEQPPDVLAGLAQAITINFPWAGLLEHVLGLREEGGEVLAAALDSLAAPGCALQALINEVTGLPGIPRRRSGPAARAPGPGPWRGRLPAAGQRLARP